MTVSQRILEVMQEKHITQKKLADYTGISTSAISDWKKKGTNPSVDKIVAISECLGVSVDYLLGRTDDPNSTQQTNNSDVHNNKNSNISVNQHNNSDIDGVSREMLDRFQTLKFEDKIEVMSLIAELSKRGV
jgi:transcriptional regulator with XRE-family HTH domain